MKTIFNIAISIALGCSCASCSDFLNLTPYSEITAENFYQNEEDFRQAVNGGRADNVVTGAGNVKDGVKVGRLAAAGEHTGLLLC